MRIPGIENFNITTFARVSGRPFARRRSTEAVEGAAENAGGEEQGDTERSEIAVLMEIKITPRQIFARNNLRNSEV